MDCCSVVCCGVATVLDDGLVAFGESGMDYTAHFTPRCQVSGKG